MSNQKFRIRQMSSKAEYEAYLKSISLKQMLGGGLRMKTIIEQNTDKIVIDRNNQTICFLGQFDVVVYDMHIINEQSLLNDRSFYFTNGLPPVEYA